MDRSDFSLTLPLDFIDRLDNAGGLALLGFYVRLASYQDRTAPVAGLLVFDNTNRAIKCLGLSRDKFYKHKATLEALGLLETHPRWGLVLKGPGVHFSDASVRKPDTAVRASDTVAGKPDTLKLSNPKEEKVMAKEREEEQRPPAPACEPTSPLGPATPAPVRELYRLGSEAGLAGDFPPLEVEGYLKAGIKRELAAFAIETAARWPSKTWAGALTMIRRWAENGIKTRAQAEEDHRQRQDRLRAGMRDERQAPMNEARFRHYAAGFAERGGWSIGDFLRHTDEQPTWYYTTDLTKVRRRQVARQVWEEAARDARPAV